MDSKPICLDCGLCCDGSLFADVKITSADLARLPSNTPASAARGNTKTWKLPQPCFAFVSGKCSIYASRPAHCRAFDCDLLAKMEAGEIPAESARTIVKQIRKKADAIRTLLRQLGNNNETFSLNDRFKHVIRRAETGSLDRKASSHFGDLTVAMQELHTLLSTWIYP